MNFSPRKEEFCTTNSAVAKVKGYSYWLARREKVDRDSCKHLVKYNNVQFLEPKSASAYSTKTISVTIMSTH